MFFLKQLRLGLICVVSRRKIVRLLTYKIKEFLIIVQIIREFIGQVKKQREDEGLTLYSVNYTQIPTLVMYDSLQKRFLIYSFHPTELGTFSCETIFLSIAESKAEVFGGEEISSYKVCKDNDGIWRVYVDDKREV
jgi:hypothetical protein